MFRRTTKKIIIIFFIVALNFPAEEVLKSAVQSLWGRKVIDKLYLAKLNPNVVDNFGAKSAQANIDSAQLEYSVSVGPITGSTSSGYNYASFFNPSASGRTAVVKKIMIQANAVTTATRANFIVRRTTALSGGTQISASDIPKKHNDSSDPVTEVRHSNPSVTLAGTADSRMMAVTAPYAAGNVSANQEINFADNEKIVLQQGEGIALYQDAAGDADHRIRFLVEWEEEASPPSSAGEYLYSSPRVAVAAGANYVFHSLFNPSGSGKTAIVKKISVDVNCDGTANYTALMTVRRTTAASAGTQIAVANIPKKHTGTANTVMEVRHTNVTATLAGTADSRLMMVTPPGAANQLQHLEIPFEPDDEKLILQEGQGIALFTEAGGDVNQLVRLNVEWQEVANASAPAAQGEYLLNFLKVSNQAVAPAANTVFYSFFNPSGSGKTAVVKRLSIRVNADTTATSAAFSWRRISAASAGTQITAADVPKKHTGTGNTAMEIRHCGATGGTAITATLSGTVDSRLLTVNGPTTVGQFQGQHQMAYGGNEKLIIQPGEGVAFYIEAAGDIDHHIKAFIEWDEEASAPSSQGEYAATIGPVNGNTGTSYNYMSFFNPSGSGKTAVVKRLELRVNANAAALYVPIQMRRITTASGGTQVTAANIPKKHTGTGNSIVEIRRTGVTVTYAGSTDSKLIGTITPGAAATTASPQIGGHRELGFKDDERIVLQPGEGIGVYHDTAAGDADFRVKLYVEWDEESSAPLSQGEYLSSVGPITGTLNANDTYASFFNPAASGKNYIVKRIEIRVNRVGAITAPGYIPATVRRTTAASGGTQISASNIPKKHTGTADTTAEVRHSNPSITLAGVSDSRVLGVTAPGLVGEACGLKEFAVTYEDELILKPGEGLALFQEAAAGDANIRYHMALEWSEVSPTISISGSIYQSNESSLDTTAYSIYISVNNTAPTAATVPADGTYTKSGISASSGNSIAVYIYNNANDANVYTVTDGTNNITGLNLIVGKVTVGNNDSGGTTTYNSDVCAQSSYPTAGSPDDKLLSCSTNDITAESGAEWHILENKTYNTNTSATLTTQGSGGNLHIDDSGSATLSSAGVVSGNVSIDTGSTLAISSTNTLGVGGSWANSGTFTANSSAVTFNAGATGKTIDSGGTGAGKTFYDVIFNNSSGGWTIQTNDMTVTRNLTITNIADSADSWTLGTGRTLEVDGTYTITGTETAYTKWTGSTLYLKGALAGAKTQATELYGTLHIGTDNDVEMWQSSAAAYTIDSGASLYSQDHAGNNGDLYIWGDYHTDTNDYWNYNDDFDGTDISGSPRQVDVRIDGSANVTVDAGDALEAVGTAANRTTVSNQGSGGYGITAATGSPGGTIDFQYADFDYLEGTTGLNIASGAVVTSLNNTAFDNMVNSGTDAFITVDSAVISTGNKTITGADFTNTGSGANCNVNRTGADDTEYWDFDAHAGSFAGEANDCKDGANEDNPGMLRWDDSGGGNQNPDTPTNLGPAGYIDASGWTSDNTPTVNFDITDPDNSEQMKYRIQIDDTAGFGSPVVDYQPSSYGAEGTYYFTVGQAGSYAVGSESMTLSDSAIGGGYYWRVKGIDDDLAESAFEEAGTDATIDFRVDATAPTGGNVYDGTSGDQDWNDGSLTQISGNWANFNADTSGLQKYEYAIRRQPDGYFWSVCSGAGVWQSGENWCDNTTSTTFTQNNLNLQTGVIYYISVKTTDNAGNVESAVNSNGQQVLPTLSFVLSSNAITFDNLNGSNSYTDTKTMTTSTSTNASTGYTTKAYETQLLTSLAYPAKTVPNFSGTWTDPLAWPGGTYGFGYTSSDASVQGSNRFNSGTEYAAFSQTVPGDIAADHTDTVNGSSGAVANEQFTITYKVAVSATQEASEYQSYVVYIVTANY